MKNKTTKKFILEKSWDLFKDNSFFSVSMQELANFLNIQKSLLFYYFQNKTNLYYEVISNYFKTLKHKFEIIFEKNLTASQKLQILSNLYLKELENDQFINFINIDNTKIDQSITKLIDQIQQEIIKHFVSIVEEGVKKGEFKPGNPEVLSLAIMGYLEKNKRCNIKLSKNWFEFLLK